MSIRLPLWRAVRDGRMSAERLLRTLGLLYPPVDIQALIKRLQIGLHFVDDLEWSGAVDSIEDEAHIFVRAGEARERQRFTMAHELGHLVLHPLGTAFRDDTFAGTEMESQANGYAAALLMPLWMLEPIINRGTTDPVALARIFEVSPRAMEIRLLRFNAVDAQIDGNF